MTKRNRWLFLVLIMASLVVGTVWWWLHRWPSSPIVQSYMQADQRLITLARPAGEPQARVVIATPPDQQLSDADLLALATSTKAALVQYEVPASDDCNLQRANLEEASSYLDSRPTWVAGINEGGLVAWRWLAEQNVDDVNALSVGSKIDEQRDCTQPLPQKSDHGHWHLAWNDNPGDETARFVRSLANADTTISNYGTPLVTLLRDQLQRQLLGQGGDVPTIEIPAEKPAAHKDTVTIFYSGDGGWRDLDRDSAQTMAENGWPVVGVDTLRYFWEHKSPERVATDLSRLMKTYRERWGAKHFVLAGYSFGADILPAVYNRLPEADQQQVSTLLLLAFARSGNFEIQVEGWLGKTGDEMQTGPEVNMIPAEKIYCIYGSEEVDESGCTQSRARFETLQITGGHHFDKDYDQLARHMMKAIEERIRP
ncbi:type IV secretory pathway VirJ component [Pseudomonas duriflava]|uniref:Type IV secretory pathway VirJ component n=1 Tax=Pseudomonas duriflava TaxID=459528 RepID=A0A562QFK7_9PSED|nr:AcvB/VirJ family lysyl-phosphatidylglycerol hydrolase [Pseudomonas duriflava]TWI55547.1 type IV secretory pathway VirJ component [Pseudomonas duriflava]